MLFERYLENIVIYGENLSLVYVVCALVSFLAVWFTWNTGPKATSTASSECNGGTPIDSSNEDLSGNNNVSHERRALLKNIEKSLSEFEKEKEFETEKQQLMEIYDLMKSDEKFNSVTIEELEEQLKLYRD